MQDQPTIILTPVRASTHPEPSPEHPVTALPEPKPAGASRSLWWLLRLAVALAFTLIMLQYMFRYGRLARIPQWDDVAYFIDGIERLDQWYQGGLRWLVGAFVNDPPHSPFSTFLAFTCFSIFGIHDWAPYVGNMLIVLAMLAFSDYALGSARRWQKIAVWLFILSMPLAFNAVGEFRPDIACGVATAIGVLMIVGWPFIESSFRRKIAIGLIFGAALLIKPAISPLTLFLLALALLLAVGREYLLAREWFNRADAMQSVLLCAGTALVVALPYYAVALGQLIGYIRLNTVGNDAQLWRPMGDWLFHLRFYLTGEGGDYMLGRQLGLLIVILAVTATIVLARGRAKEISRLLIILAMIAAAYAVPTISRMKTEFFGATFQALLVFSVVLALSAFMQMRIEDGRRRSATVILVTLAALLLLEFPDPKTRVDVTSLNNTVNAVHGIIRQNAAPQAKGFVTSAGYLNKDNLRYMALRDRIDVSFTDLHRSDDLEQYRAAFDQADIVVAGELGSLLAYETMPSAKVQDQTLQMIQDRRDFRRIGKVPAPEGKFIYVFQKLR